MDNGGLLPMDVAVGDHILFGEYTGQKTHVDGKEYLMMRNSEVIGKLHE